MSAWDKFLYGEGGFLTYSGLFGNLLAGSAIVWSSLVNRELTEPYLDEFFHIRQALVFYDNRFDVWDEKITTPPGLYLVSYIWLNFCRVILRIGPDHDEMLLRFLNVIGLVFVKGTLDDLVQSVQVSLRLQNLKVTEPIQRGSNSYPASSRAHVATNIALFPVLFFFSALYYTDVISALVVLKAHAAFYSDRPILALPWSLISLTFRQTNVFWTAIYLAALEVKRSLDRQVHVARVGGPKGPKLEEKDVAQPFAKVIVNSWKFGRVYDRGSELASPEDYIKTALSLVIATLSSVQVVIIPLIPHIAVLISFVTFVLINGGVVLGDKSNHVASLHLPQMLYIWPYIVFFSFPVILGRLASKMFAGTLMVPRPSTVVVLVVAAALCIALNTIVHPFILADNRHYTFYVFRILLRHPAIKFMAAPIYVACGWASIAAFDSRTSTILIWLAVSALSLITAPLVEPRYFILPWIFWRLHIGQSQPLPAASMSAGKRTFSPAILKLGRLLVRHMLLFETLWFVAINAATGYIFLKWKFEWPQEPGAVMRFMW